RTNKANSRADSVGPAPVPTTRNPAVPGLRNTGTQNPHLTPGGVSNPITVIEQFTYLLFMRQLDDRQRTAEKAANLLGGEPDPSQMFYDAEHRHLRFSEMAAIDSPEERA
ncbi:hypothetical protein ACL1IP_13625, partial [Corynebacterium striatum]